MTKYTLGEAVQTNIDGEPITVYRIEYTDGTRGGYIQSEANLSQEGSCRIEGAARVVGTSSVEDDAIVAGTAVVIDSSIKGKSKVRGETVVRECTLTDGALISMHAVVINTNLTDYATVSGKAYVVDSMLRGFCEVYNKAHVEKSTLMDSASACENAVLKNVVASGNAKFNGKVEVEGKVVGNNYVSSKPEPKKDLPFVANFQKKIVSNEPAHDSVYSSKSVIISMTITDVQVPVIIPGDVHKHSNELEVILPRGVTLKINSETGHTIGASNNTHGVHWNTTVVNPTEIAVNEVYDGDLFVKTGEMKLMEFKSFQTKKEEVKTNYGTEIFLKAVAYLQETDKSLEKDEIKTRTQDKFLDNVG
ncbi:MAG: hypothetical protein ACRC3J_05760 [Culicoidibacterales bacterium]